MRISMPHFICRHPAWVTLRVAPVRATFSIVSVRLAMEACHDRPIPPFRLLDLPFPINWPCSRLGLCCLPAGHFFRRSGKIFPADRPLPLFGTIRSIAHSRITALFGTRLRTFRSTGPERWHEHCIIPPAITEREEDDAAGVFRPQPRNWNAPKPCASCSSVDRLSHGVTRGPGTVGDNVSKRAYQGLMMSRWHVSDCGLNTPAAADTVESGRDSRIC